MDASGLVPGAGDEAERWYARLSSPACTASDLLAFDRWVRQSPAHERAYAEVEHRVAAADALMVRDPRLRSPDRGLAPSLPTNVPGRAQGHARPGRRRWIAVAAAAMLAVVAAAGWLLRDALAPPPEPLRYAATDQVRSLLLDDGSRVRLDVQTDIEVALSDRGRSVELRRGRALFEVAHEPARPFTVRAGSGEITVLGTRFQVERLADLVQVTLTEGALQVRGEGGTAGAVREERLHPGEQLRYSSDLDTWSKREVDMDVTTAWSRGRLIFRAAPLGEAVEEVNRYSNRKLRLGDAALASLEITGNFVAGDADAVAEAWQAMLPVRVQASGDDELVLVRTRR